MNNMKAVFAGILMMVVTANAIHVCNSGWNIYAPSCNTASFSIAGCDGIFVNELVRQGFPRNKCTFVSVLARNAVCITPSSLVTFGSCRVDGSYGFDANVVVRCPTGFQRWGIATTGKMKNGKIKMTSFYFQPYTW